MQLPKTDFLMFHCAACGKEKYKHGEEWGWHYGGQLCCSWTCQRVLERAAEEKAMKKKARVVDPQPGKHLTDEEREEALRLLRTGMTQYDVAKRLGSSETTIGKLARDNGLRRLNHGGVKSFITPEMIAQMTKLYHEGLSYVKIAKTMGVARSTAEKYVKMANKTGPIS